MADGELQELATATQGLYKVAITDDRTTWFYKMGVNEPVYAGIWMGWPEKSWGITEAAFTKLPLKEQAKLEAAEQLKWIVSPHVGFESLHKDQWGSNET